MDDQETITVEHDGVLAEVKKLALAGATYKEMAAVLGLTTQVLRERYRAEIRKARASLRVGLRSAQIRKAMAGDPRMLTWLGKHELGQDADDASAADPVKTYVGVDVEAV